MKRNIELTEKQRVDALRDQGRKQKLETGAIAAQMAGSGLSMDFGSPLELQLYNEIGQEIDTNRLNSSYDNAVMSEHIATNNANDALAQQRAQYKSQKTGAIWSTIGSVAGTAVSAAGAASGGAPSGGQTPPSGMPDTGSAPSVFSGNVYAQ